MSKRQTLSLDYKIFHSEGRKVVKVRDTDTIMESEISELTKNLHSLAINCRSDVEDFFDTYDIDELENEEDLQNYISKIEGVKRDFRRVHAQIKSTDEANFDTQYPYYSNDLDKLNQHFKNASKKMIRKKGW